MGLTRCARSRIPGRNRDNPPPTYGNRVPHWEAGHSVGARGASSERRCARARVLFAPRSSNGALPNDGKPLATRVPRRDNQTDVRNPCSAVGRKSAAHPGHHMAPQCMTPERTTLSLLIGTGHTEHRAYFARCVAGSGHPRTTHLGGSVRCFGIHCKFCKRSACQIVSIRRRAAHVPLECGSSAANFCPTLGAVLPDFGRSFSTTGQTRAKSGNLGGRIWAPSMGRSAARVWRASGT